jgi:hypothetical protein
LAGTLHEGIRELDEVYVPRVYAVGGHQVKKKLLPGGLGDHPLQIGN